AQAFDVKNYLNSGDNEAAVQGTDIGGMAALQQILVVEYVGEDEEPGTGSNVSLNVTIVPGISLEVSPSALDFGELYAGKISESQYITLKNSGGCNITVTAEVSDSSAGEELFSKGLLLDSLLWSEYSKVIGTGSQASTAVALKVPSSSGFGNKKGTITFWAEAAE
ncbi:MAG: cell surface protein, partial [Methanosarcinaceae archaeon]|nr:cell surface protein [Methanosarcinaceae archaeon]